VFLGVSVLAVIMTLSGIILTASRLHHSARESEPPFSKWGYLAVWALAAAALSTSLVLVDLLIAVGLAGLAVFVVGWAVVLQRLFW
jgi:hypothetical protein